MTQMERIGKISYEGTAPIHPISVICVLFWSHWHKRL
jgi:hypothetical protein